MGDLTLEQTLTTARALNKVNKKQEEWKEERIEASVNKVKQHEYSLSCGLSGHIQSDPSCPARGRSTVKACTKEAGPNIYGKMYL